MTTNFSVKIGEMGIFKSVKVIRRPGIWKRIAI